MSMLKLQANKFSSKNLIFDRKTSKEKIDIFEKGCKRFSENTFLTSLGEVFLDN